jgi:hypothetical protein
MFFFIEKTIYIPEYKPEARTSRSREPPHLYIKE